ncbi:MAG: hypothetical protein ACMUIU_10505 [bacterium]
MHLIEAAPVAWNRISRSVRHPFDDSFGADRECMGASDVGYVWGTVQWCHEEFNID